jgi:hypothetical protein
LDAEHAAGGFGSGRRGDEYVTEGVNRHVPPPRAGRPRTHVDLKIFLADVN